MMFDLLQALYDAPVAQCESGHNGLENALCSGDAVARISRGCLPGETRLVCARQVVFMARCMTDPAYICQDCNRPTIDCWTVIPA